MAININPFGTSTDSPTTSLAQIKLFGCTVVDFNVSADWSSQGGGLSCKVIEIDTDGDRLVIPVLGSPVLFELKDTSGNILFQYIGIVDSFSRSSSNTKIYNVNLSSPLKILDCTNVIIDGYTGLGSSIEGSYNLNGLTNQDFGHNNSLITVDNTPGSYHWWNVSNLINVFGILENDDVLYRVPTNLDADLFGLGTRYGDFGFSAKNNDGIPLIKLMWALHIGINHLPPVSSSQRQRTHGGNLLFGRHNYNLYDDQEAIPYYYHFDAIHFYNQVVNKLGPEYRISGPYKTLSEIISNICNEANLEFFSYIDIYTEQTIGDPTLQDEDQYINRPAVMNWEAGVGQSMSSVKFPLGGNYGGTIRIQTIDKNTFFNQYRPFSNIAYNLIGLEVPDLKDEYWNPNAGLHPGKLPAGVYSDPLDSLGIDSTSHGFTDAGFGSMASGGSFPFQATGVGGTPVLFDSTKLDDIKISNSEISLKLNDFTTMKVVTGGYQSRLVDVPRNMLRHYWGDIILNEPEDPRAVAETETDSIGLNEVSIRKIPVVTQLLDPRDINDYVLIDMKSDFGPISIDGVLKDGVYAASLFEIRCAMSSYESWKAFIETYKYQKIRNFINFFYPGCTTPSGQNNLSKDDLQKSTQNINGFGGAGYSAISNALGLGNIFSLNVTSNGIVAAINNQSGNPVASPSGTGAFGLGLNIPCLLAELNVKQFILPPVHEKIKEIGDAHYGKSWYAPVPYAKTIEDLDGNNLVGNFKRSWQLADSAYVEPSNYYDRKIPQSNMFIIDGKINPFVNYDYNFISSNTGQYDTNYAQDITNLIGREQKVCNFSEYSLDKLCITRYVDVDIIHASPESVEDTYSFLPFGYDYYYDRSKVSYHSILDGVSKKYVQVKNSGSALIGDSVGQSGTSYAVMASSVNSFSGIYNNPLNFYLNISTNEIPSSGEASGQVPSGSGYFQTTILPSATDYQWLVNTVAGIQSLSYKDNGRFSFPFVKFTTSRVFLPVPKPGFLNGNGMGDIPSLDGLNAFLGTKIKPSGGRVRQHLLTEDVLLSVLRPFQACVVPKSFSYPQVSTRYVYGPWITNINYVPFRGKVEYEQDDALVPENFLIPNNFGEFGSFTLKQTSGLAGMNMAAQGRANAIDDFALFAVEEGSITIPSPPAIQRIGDSLYGVQQITDIKINISNEKIETTYSFKTILPKFGKNTRDLEKKLTKISNDIKKIKFR